MVHRYLLTMSALTLEPLLSKKNYLNELWTSLYLIYKKLSNLQIQETKEVFSSSAKAPRCHKNVCWHFPAMWKFVRPLVPLQVSPQCYILGLMARQSALRRRSNICSDVQYGFFTHVHLGPSLAMDWIHIHNIPPIMSHLMDSSRSSLSNRFSLQLCPSEGMSVCVMYPYAPHYCTWKCSRPNRRIAHFSMILALS